MYVGKTRALAGVALLSAFSLILLLLGTFISVNTLFFTALAAYIIGYSIYKYRLGYGAMQLAVCTILDFILNPDKFHWILYLCLGGYIFLSEWIFRTWNHMEDGRKKMRRQLIYNWILFNILYMPVVFFFSSLLSEAEIFRGISGKLLLIAAGEFGWLVYDKAYREFFKFIRERRL